MFEFDLPTQDPFINDVVYELDTSDWMYDSATTFDSFSTDASFSTYDWSSSDTFINDVIYEGV